ncbi:unnamed protein product [Orchesella dallaii]|uniref:Uncharacterized protein n=1 Tax=Orchesella dallaii TaxID=48710 RepID=A0ABP1Q932_9HEXA
MSICLITIFVFTFLRHSSGATCTCDKLVLTSIFQVGPCGRAARCFWEVMHFKINLLGADKTTLTQYEDNIKQMLCRIPTYGTRKYASDSQDTYQVCNSATLTEFYHFPMPTQYHADKDKNFYLVRQEECTMKEKECNTELWKEITTLCDGITDADVKTLDGISQMKMRDLKVYKFAVGGCKISTLRRKSTRSVTDDTGEPKYTDVYNTTNLKYPKLRSPYFELHLLYALDPLKKLGGTAIEDRWDEKKAFMDLANYLPQLMIHHMHTAIQCIYNRVNSEQMKWDPTKFCGNISTFMCVDFANLKGTDCIALGLDPHNVDNKEVPKI